MDTSEPRVWSLDEILDYLEKWGGTFVVRDGRTCVQFPKELGNRRAVEDAVIPHLRAMKSEIVAYLKQTYPDAWVGNVQLEQKSLEKTRAKIISDAMKRAVASGRKLLFLKRNGEAVGDDHPPLRKHYTRPFKRKVVVPVSREATAVCVRGEPWTPLPKVTTPEEDDAIKPQKGKSPTRDGLKDRPVNHGYLEDA